MLSNYVFIFCTWHPHPPSPTVTWSESLFRYADNPWCKISNCCTMRNQFESKAYWGVNIVTYADALNRLIIIITRIIPSPVFNCPSLRPNQHQEYKNPTFKYCPISLVMLGFSKKIFWFKLWFISQLCTCPSTAPWLVATHCGMSTDKGQRGGSG